MNKNILHSLALTLILLVVALLPSGVSAGDGYCWKTENDEYQCGGGEVKLSTVVDQPIANMWTETCDMNECCCREQNGWEGGSHFQAATCTDQDNTKIGCYACAGGEACYGLDNSKIGDYGCVGKEACYGANNLVVGRKACTGEYACYLTDDGVIGSNSCKYPWACYYADDSTIGSNSCVGERACEFLVNSDIGSNSCVGRESCYLLNGAEIGNDSCKDQFSCKYIGPRDERGIGAAVTISNFAWKVGTGSCIGNGISCYNAGRGDLYNALVEPQGVDIGDSSCNANEVCRDCEAGSVVPAGTCNDLNNVDEVGTLSQEGDYDGTTGTRKGDKRCRACFAELHPEDYSVSVAVTAPATTTKPSRQPSKKPNKKKPRSKNGKKSTKAKGKKKRKSEKTMDDSGDLFE